VGGQGQARWPPARPKKDTEGGHEWRGVRHGLYFVPRGVKELRVFGWGEAFRNLNEATAQPGTAADAGFSAAVVARAGGRRG
jgi:hypothetical protein